MLRTIEVAGARIAYGDTGSGAPVLALHGSASTGAMWRSLAGFIGTRLRLLTPDLPGYGASGTPAVAGPLGRELAAVVSLASSLREPVHLVGHGFGGVVALEAARLMPSLVRSLTLIEPTAFHLLERSRPGDRLLAQEIDVIAERMMAGATWDDPEGATRRYVDYWNGTGAWAHSSPRLQAFLLAALPQVVANLVALRALPARPDYARITCPALVVMGLESPLPMLRVSDVLARRLPAAELRMIGGAGHMAPLTDPHLVDPMIVNHLLRPAALPLALAS
jgi:pimeloyl-ACP methyl ester carboxylesterase